MLLTIETGALATTVYRLPFKWAVVSIVVGTFLGSIFMALHSAQGARLGVPQMIQTRGQFGSLGSLLVVGLVIIMYLGFFASNLVVGGQALHLMVPVIPHNLGIFAIGALSVAAAILGHDLIHAYARVMTYVCGLVLLFAFFWIVEIHGLPTDFFSRNEVTTYGVLGAISIAALWQIACAPYVSDYSRYMPADTGPRSAFWATYWGASLSTIVSMTLGVIVGLCVSGRDVIASLDELLDGTGSLVLVVFSLGIAANNSMNLYCGTLASLTFGQTILSSWSPKASGRAVAATILFVLSMAMAVLARDSFLIQYTNFILLLLYVLVPWTAINLVDYYFIQHGDYDVDSFLRKDGGIYGRVNGIAVGSYLLGILAQVPFMSTPLFTGKIASLMHGADLSWIVGLSVAGPVYYCAARMRKSRSPGGGEAVAKVSRSRA